MNQGVLKANAIVVAEITADFLPGSGKIRAKAAFVNTQTGKSHGWTENFSWSPEVQGQLELLKEAMEEDLARIHLEDYGPQVRTTQNEAAPSTGLVEHLTGDAPAV